MAKQTPVTLKNFIIYSIYVRNHSQSGTFREVIIDLERIASLGVDAIWLMPIHPIGEKNKKGSLGCPYSISDYRSINPEYGSVEDFTELIAKAHRSGLKVLIDVVYNHTSHDSILIKQHPEFFFQDNNGNPTTTVPEWSDVIDLKHPNRKLTNYLIESLKYWVSLGVDGFRCDVASIVPLGFWKQAQSELNSMNENLVWLAESVDTAFIENRRKNGQYAMSDGELYNVFDITYDYDIWPLFVSTIKGQSPVERLLEIYRFQQTIYPENAIKLHFVENHDQVRIQKFAKSQDQALAWTAFQAFNDGAWLIYAGLEAGEDHTPSLFDRDPIHWKDRPFQDYVTRLCKIKKHSRITNGKLIFLAAVPCIQAAWVSETGVIFGIFNISSSIGNMKVNIPDGTYNNLLGDFSVSVMDGTIVKPKTACIFEVPSLLDDTSIHSELMDSPL
jgi:glycosidase